MLVAFGPCRRCGTESRSKERHIYTTDRAKSFIASRFVLVDLPPKKRERPTYRSVEGAKPKTNGKWRSGLFPGREFDDLDEFRAAKKQREERREEYRAQVRDNRCHVH